MKFFKHRILSAVTLIMIVSVFLVGPTYQVQGSRFVIAAHSWSYPDEYGQGIEYVYFINSLVDPYNWTYQFWNGTEKDASGDPAGLEILHGAEVSMRVHVWLNGTQTGYSYADGRDLYTRVGIEVYYLSDLVFSQENLTQAGGSLSDDPMWQYDYTILLNGDPLYNPPDFEGGLIYTVLFTYEIFS